MRFILLCIAGIPWQLAAQQDTLSPVFGVQVNAHAGKLVKIHGAYPENHISTLMELNLRWKTQNRNSWEGIFGYPSYGLSIMHAQFGNQSILGQSIGMMPTLEFDRRKGKNRFALRGGLGLAWFNKPYDFATNPDNLVIGSSLANMTNFRYEWSRPINENMRFNLGLSFTHYSNAHVRVPNIGANVVALSAGVSFTRKEVELDRHDKTSFCFGPIRHWALGAQGILGFQEAIGTLKPADGPLYPIYGGSLYAVRSSNVGKDIHIGLHYHYYPYYKEYALSQELFASSREAKRSAQSIVFFMGYEWRFRNFGVIAQVGINLYNPFIQAIHEVWDLPKHGILYRYTSNKLGYRYYLLNSFHHYQPFIQVAVKANGGTADYLETGLGLFINPKPRVRPQPKM